MFIVLISRSLAPSQIGEKALNERGICDWMFRVRYQHRISTINEIFKWNFFYSKYRYTNRETYWRNSVDHNEYLTLNSDHLSYANDFLQNEFRKEMKKKASNY